MNEWGIPDWRDPAAYGDANRWTFNRWRWEFYRRRDDLRKVFLSASEMEKDSPELGFTREGRPPQGQPGHYVHAQTRWLFGYSHKLPDPSVSEHPEELLFCDEGLHAALPPVLIERETARPGKKFQVPKIEVPIRHGAVVVFDLDHPLDPQFKAARRAIGWAQSSLHGKPLQKRRHPTKWLGYLRTLDAREAGASWAEIAGLHPNTAQTEQTARDIWEQARALCFNF